MASDELPIDDRIDNALAEWRDLPWWEKAYYWVVTL